MRFGGIGERIVPDIPNRDMGKREAAVTVKMELKRIIINEVHDQQVVMLREIDGERSFPIVIGIFEAPASTAASRTCLRRGR